MEIDNFTKLKLSNPDVTAFKTKLNILKKSEIIFPHEETFDDNHITNSIIKNSVIVLGVVIESFDKNLIIKDELFILDGHHRFQYIKNNLIDDLFEVVLVNIYDIKIESYNSELLIDDDFFINKIMSEKGFSEKEKSYFSTRIFLICGGILILTLPSVFEGIRVTIALTSISIAFLISRTTPRVSLRRHHLNIQNLVGSSGDSQRIALLDCSCEGACPSLSTNQISGGSFLGIANLSCKALCLEVEEQYSLMQLANTENLSKIVITGCDGTPLPFLMKNKLNKIGTNIEGLQWLNLPANVSEDWLNKSLEDYFSDLQVE